MVFMLKLCDWHAPFRENRGFIFDQTGNDVITKSHLLGAAREFWFLGIHNPKECIQFPVQVLSTLFVYLELSSKLITRFTGSGNFKKHLHGTLGVILALDPRKKYNCFTNMLTVYHHLKFRRTVANPQLYDTFTTLYRALCCESDVERITLGQKMTSIQKNSCHHLKFRKKTVATCSLFDQFTPTSVRI